MSKYIRTKENTLTPWGVEQKEHIYRVDETDKTISFIRTGISTTFKKIEKSLTEFLKSFVKSADTIEELVDELVVVEPNNEDCPRPYILDCFHLCTYNSWFEREKEHIKNGVIVVYGSIWIDGNLTKVAKMNDKGEFELL